MIRSPKALAPAYIADIEYYRRTKCDEFLKNTNTRPDGCMIWLGTVDEDGWACYKPARETRDRNVLGRQVIIYQFMYFSFMFNDEDERIKIVWQSGNKFIFDTPVCGVRRCINPEHVINRKPEGLLASSIRYNGVVLPKVRSNPLVDHLINYGVGKV